MGFFSQQCQQCGKSLLSVYATNAVNSWMMHAVAITPDGGIHVGEYDGYGRIDGAEDAVGYANTVYHRACWELAGSPLDYKGESPSAPDQGFFFNDDDYADPDPRVSW